MKLIKLLMSGSRSMILLALAAGLVSGACNAGLIALINTSLHDTKLGRTTLMWIFFGIIGLKVATNAFSQMQLGLLSQKVVSEMRTRLIRKILVVSLRRLEEIGGSRIMASLIDDVGTITATMFALPTMAINAAVLITGAAYLCWLFPLAFGVVALSIVIGVGGYRWVVKRGFRFVKAAREQQDSLFAHIRSLTEGVKELKLHRDRREAFLEERVGVATRGLQENNYKATQHFIVGHAWSQTFLFGAIGWILFGMPRSAGSTPEALTGYLLTFVYLLGPMATLLNMLPALGRANIALQKVETLGVSLESLSGEPVAPPAKSAGVPWKSLELVDVVHSYHRENDDSHFQLGPVNVAFKPGELVLLVGGNGSGKSTLVKLITGLYSPEKGQILWDGKPVTDESRDAYRQNFSVVFSDFYLFESLLGLMDADTDARAKTYLERLHLQTKVQVKDGVLSTTALSQGQRKRLALLTAYLEDRPFYVFDEWASDQDPVFKDIFYRQILQELKARGKTVLVITHDDRYTDVADRLYKMEEGKLRALHSVPAAVV